MVGDILEKRIKEISFASDGSGEKGGKKLWQILKNIALEELKNAAPGRVSSNDIIPIYYRIVFENQNLLPNYCRERLPSNKQERYRVIIRNLFVTNAFHQDGLASCKEIRAVKVVNESRRGCRVIYQFIGG